MIFINLPYDQVDVNVHPAKREVRFSDQNKVHDAVKAAVKNALDLLDPYKKTVWEISRKKQAGKASGVSESQVFYEPAGESDSAVHGS